MKSILLAFTMLFFVGATFAKDNVKVVKETISKVANVNTEKSKDRVTSVIDKFITEKNVTKITVADDDQGYILIKVAFMADCPGYFSVVAVLTIKVWDDGSLEFYPWFQEESLICS